MTRIYYFTRTGGSEKIAKEIAAQTGGTICPINDSKKWNGVIGFIKAGYYASAKKSIPASYDKPSDEDTIYLCFPIWAGAFPPAIRFFISKVGRDKIIAVPTSKSSELSDKSGFIKVISVIGEDKTVKL